MRILIIEDDESVAQVLADAIRAEGHEARIALVPQAGLDMLALERPDGIFLDVVMPGMSGIEVLRRLRGGSCDVPVVVITGFATAKEIAEARALGAADVIEKPVLLKHLGTAMEFLRSVGAGC